MEYDLKQEKQIREYIWDNRTNTRLFANSEKQIDLKLKIAASLGISSKKDIELLDEGIARAFKDQNNPKYSELFKEGNPDLIEAVALCYYYLGNTNTTNLIENQKLFDNLDLSKDESLAIQFVNQITDRYKTHRKNIRKYLETQKNIAKLSLPERVIKTREIKVQELTEMPVR